MNHPAFTKDNFTLCTIHAVRVRERSSAFTLGFSFLPSCICPSLAPPAIAGILGPSATPPQPPLCHPAIEPPLLVSLGDATHLVSHSLPTSSLLSSLSQILVHSHVFTPNSVRLFDFSSSLPLSLDCFLPFLVSRFSLPPSKSTSSAEFKQPLLDFYGVLAKSSQLFKAASQFSLEIDANWVSSIYDMQSSLVGQAVSLCALQDSEFSVYGMQSLPIGKTGSLCASQKVTDFSLPNGAIDVQVQSVDSNKGEPSPLATKFLGTVPNGLGGMSMEDKMYRATDQGIHALVASVPSTNLFAAVQRDDDSCSPNRFSEGILPDTHLKNAKWDIKEKGHRYTDQNRVVIRASVPTANSFVALQDGVVLCSSSCFAPDALVLDSSLYESIRCLPLQRP
ncbi:hypothetical protein Nepgr_033265 [Nepenthes gracilis]|uniref:Uncharacterized protein n=1 Tax=Nepenthes gracilis TaxID=150966 RepID=A0AAD3Y6G3_NEPGR|nr:hypothetical protein Nepgr_033265 [Nepenthes gracilis]